MSTSDRTFQQVKSILGKLDRSIDEARQRRVGDNTEPTPEPQAAQPEQATPPPAPEPTRPEDISPNRARYGRATPLPSPRRTTPTWAANS